MADDVRNSNADLILRFLPMVEMANKYLIKLLA